MIAMDTQDLIEFLRTRSAVGPMVQGAFSFNKAKHGKRTWRLDCGVFQVWEKFVQPDRLIRVIREVR